MREKKYQVTLRLGNWEQEARLDEHELQCAREIAQELHKLFASWGQPSVIEVRQESEHLIFCQLRTF